MKFAATVVLGLGGLLLAFLLWRQAADDPAREDPGAGRPDDEPVWVDPERAIMWIVEPSQPMSWGEAQRHAKELVYAGYADWRLPTKAELWSLIVWKIVGKDDDLGVTRLFDRFRTPEVAYMFSGTLVHGRPDSPYIMNLENGHIFNGYQYRAMVRAVRETAHRRSAEKQREVVSQDTLDHQRQKDEETIQALANAGSDLSKRHSLEHHFVCSTRAAAERVLAWGIAARYRWSRMYESEIEGRPYVYFDLVKTTVPSIENITAQTRAMLEVAAEHGVEYDGWGCVIVK